MYHQRYWYEGSRRARARRPMQSSRKRASSHPLMPADATFKQELVVVIKEETHCHDQRKNVRSILFRLEGQLKMAL